MRTTTLILLVVACFQASIQQNCDQEVLSIVMVMDASGSVGLSDFNLARDATVEMIKQMDVNPNKVHVGYVVYDTKVQVFSTLVSNDQHKQQLIGTIGNINYFNFGGGTATGTALDMAHKLFGAISRPFVPKIVVLFTDGYSNSGLAVNPAADALKRDGIDIFAVGVTSYVNEAELNYVSSEPKSKYLLKLSDYQQLYSLINGITQTMCGASAFIEPGQKAEIESPQNQKRNFQTDLTKLRSQSSARASMILIDLDIHEGLPILSHSFDNPFTSRTDMIEAKPARERINPDNSRTITYYAFPGPNDKRLYYSVVASAPGNNRYDLSIRAL